MKCDQFGVSLDVDVHIQALVQLQGANVRTNTCNKYQDPESPL